MIALVCRKGAERWRLIFARSAARKCLQRSRAAGQRLVGFQPCLLLSNEYLKYLSDYTTVITKLQVALLNHDSSGLPDLSGVTQVQAQVDADGTQADSALGEGH